MSIHIAAYEEKYHERLVDLWERAVRATHDFLPEEDIRHFRTVVENEALLSVEVWVALDEDGEPAGFAGADGRKIEMLFVDPGRQGKGIGRELINHIKKLKGEPLQVDVNEQNPGACAFYERLGFVRVGRSELDGSGKPYPLLHLDLRRRSAGWRLDNSYAGLPDMFYAKMEPTPVAAPKLSVLNEALAVSLGLNVSELASREGVEELAGNRIPEGGEPLAQAYAGHQFGHLNMLGDGRAILLGEQIAPDGRRADVQLKGSGPTPYSRRGDGRAALGPMLREYIISEAMHALGIPTTRSLAVVETGESVYRETELPGAILTRIAASHIRVGTFQYAAGRGTPEDVRTLADYTLRRHYPEAAAGENPALALLRSVIGRQAELIARWQLVGFVHGVMNTDNMALSGETIDYGPCAFMDAYDPKTVFSSIDTQGRYAYGNQPYIAAWNLTRFAETLLPLLHEDEAEAVRMAEGELSEFSRLYHRHWLNGMRGKLGLFGEEEEDEALAVDLLALLQKHGADYTNTFVALTFDRLEGSPVFEAAEFGQWQERWQARRARHAESESASFELMRGRNPAIIPRNHRVEEALDAATNHGDYGAIEKLLRALSDPFAHAPEQEEYARLPERCDAPYRTFCGT